MYAKYSCVSRETKKPGFGNRKRNGKVGGPVKSLKKAPHMKTKQERHTWGGCGGGWGVGLGPKILGKKQGGPALRKSSKEKRKKSVRVEFILPITLRRKKPPTKKR